MLGVVGVENGRWKKGSTKPAEKCDFSADGRTEIISYNVTCVAYRYHVSYQESSMLVR